MTVLVAAVVVAAAAWLLTQTAAHPHEDARSPASSATATSTAPVPAPVEATGTIVYGRQLTVGQFTDVSDGVYRTPPEGVSRQVTMDRVCCLGASPATGRVSYSVSEDGRAETYDLATSQSQFTTRAHRIKLVPSALSNAARWVAFEGWAYEQSHNGAYIQPARGGALQQITTTPTLQRDRPLAFSPDDSRLLFFRRDRLDQNGELYVINVDGDRMVQLSSARGRRRLLLLRLAGIVVSQRSPGCVLGIPTASATAVPDPVRHVRGQPDGSHRHRITIRP